MGVGPSRSVCLGRVQMMMRHLAAIGETYAQTTLEDAAWNLWLINPSQASTSTSTSSPNNPNPSTSTISHQGGHTTGVGTVASLERGSSDPPLIYVASSLGGGGSLIRTTPPPPILDVDLSNITAMAEVPVREVLPHDLQRTNSVLVTVNNLLQM
ncbi:unnamed protein product [Lactuca saligna]|uniref:Uncharacterized protein n=1 Tax=Lactuca saligna TaxID=75948 RepID=A0AA35YKS6_LACSI|nr:unnamed protein product [Lactuca saligna]